MLVFSNMTSYQTSLQHFIHYNIYGIFKQTTKRSIVLIKYLFNTFYYLTRISLSQISNSTCYNKIMFIINTVTCYYVMLCLCGLGSTYMYLQYQYDYKFQKGTLCKINYVISIFIREGQERICSEFLPLPYHYIKV